MHAGPVENNDPRILVWMRGISRPALAEPVELEERR